MAKRKRINSPLAEHIADYSDMELYDDGLDDIVSLCESNNRDKNYFDDSDEEWMYNNTDVDDSLECSENMWDKESDSEVLSSPRNPVINKDVDKYMTSAVWFNEMSERGMSNDEKRYVELMLIELEKFYFSKLESSNISDKSKQIIKKIHDDIEEKVLCIER